MAIKLSTKLLADYRNMLIREEKSPATVEKYLRDVKKLYDFIGERGEAEKQDIVAFKNQLLLNGQISSANSVLTTVNSFLSWVGKGEYRVKIYRIQRSLFCNEERELTRREYERLLSAAGRKGKKRLYLLMQTICSTGIRISEVRFMTVEALHAGKAEVTNKGNTRTVFMPRELRNQLMKYIKAQGITSGPIFITRNKNPLDRSNIWKEMKALGRQEGIPEKKVFPHNLRHLFARVFYQKKKDVVHLADILGHASVNTTRIYTISSGREHRRAINSLGLDAVKARPAYP